MQCPMCKKNELEMYNTDLNLDRKGIRVWLTCSDNVCPYYKVLELGINDIIGIGRSPGTEAESKDAIRKAMDKVK